MKKRKTLHGVSKATLCVAKLEAMLSAASRKKHEDPMDGVKQKWGTSVLKHPRSRPNSNIHAYNMRQATLQKLLKSALWPLLRARTIVHEKRMPLT